jgi:2-polyprenyl-6-methoxyphenol hydroxylase-like FAD-dependent oxidoreductase
MERYDAVIVGGRCAGATVGAALARAGWRVVMLDKDAEGSDTLSTHLVFPNTIARLAELGVLEDLSRRHELRPVGHRMRLIGREFAGRFTPVDGRDGALGIRRPALDAALARAAAAAGVESRFGEKVDGLLHDGPQRAVTGVRLASGERIHARWVLGADGRASLVARELRLARTGELRGELSMMLSYWRGLPATDMAHVDMEPGAGVARFPCEDGVDLLISMGDGGHTRGDRALRERHHLERLSEFPHTIDRGWLVAGERVSDVRAAPETMLRGFFRQAAGPGWALVGDAGHFKHPASAQGIGDAIAQALRLAASLAGEDPQLREYGRWRDRRAEGHYEWSFTLGRFPRHGITDPVADGLAGDADAAQDFRDSLARRVAPQDVLSEQRLSAWFGRSPVSDDPPRRAIAHDVGLR